MQVDLEQPHSSISPSYYLFVPYEEKDEAKRLGARWDKYRKQWYVQGDNKICIDKWGEQNFVLNHLKNEDRTFMNNTLHIELLPSSCWCRDIQYAIKKHDRPRVLDFVLGRENRRCEICKVKDIKKSFYMHGRWDFDMSTNTQKLVRLMCLCNQCYDSTHYGMSYVKGRSKAAGLHYQNIHNISKVDFKDIKKEAYNKQKVLNNVKWTLDLSLLSDNGIRCETNGK